MYIFFDEHLNVFCSIVVISFLYIESKFASEYLNETSCGHFGTVLWLQLVPPPCVGIRKCNVSEAQEFQQTSK